MKKELLHSPDWVMLVLYVSLVKHTNSIIHIFRVKVTQFLMRQLAYCLSSVKGKLSCSVCETKTPVCLIHVLHILFKTVSLLLQ